MNSPALSQALTAPRGLPLGVRFGRTVRHLRETYGWSQEHLAARAELNRSYLGEVERGTVMPSLSTAEKLALAFELSLAGLIDQCEARHLVNTRP